MCVNACCPFLSVSPSAVCPVQVWCVQTGLLLVTARGHTGEISDLSLSADGTMVASGATDADVRVWSLQVRASADSSNTFYGIAYV